MAEALLSNKNKKILKDGVWDTNPITYQVLGICSALAVTTQLKTALVMSFGLTFVTAMSNVVISLIRNYIPSQIRIIVQLTVVSALVITIDQLLRIWEGI